MARRPIIRYGDVTSPGGYGMIVADAMRRELKLKAP